MPLPWGVSSRWHPSSIHSPHRTSIGQWLPAARRETRYSALKQINASNVNQLKVAWTYDVSDAPGTIETNPIEVDGVLYGYTAGQKVFAVNAATGKQMWLFNSAELGRGNNRGLSYWRDGSDERIFAGIREYVYSLDAKTGKPDPHFGDNGRIDFRADLRGGPAATTGALGHPPVIYKDLVIFAGRTSQVLPALAGACARLRCADRQTALAVQYDSAPGEYGYDTWPKDAWTYTAGGVSWMGMALDEKRGIVYVPTSNTVEQATSAAIAWATISSPTRSSRSTPRQASGSGTFRRCNIDVWDRDVVSPPTLITVKRDGKDVDAVEIATKSGYVWLFDRTNGAPLFPIERKRYRASAIPGEQLSETQPLPTRPAPFARQMLTADMLTQRTPEAHAAALARFNKMVSAGAIRTAQRRRRHHSVSWFRRRR